MHKVVASEPVSLAVKPKRSAAARSMSDIPDSTTDLTVIAKASSLPLEQVRYYADRDARWHGVLCRNRVTMACERFARLTDAVQRL
jgi:hypothetical protein